MNETTLRLTATNSSRFIWGGVTLCKYQQMDYALYFGRFSEEKGIGTLIKVCKELPDVQFVFAGTGPLEDTINGVSNIKNVEFQRGEALEKLIREARFSIYPSEWYENCPFSVMESQMYGTPVLGSEIGGIPELIQVGKTGELFESGNAEDLKRKVQKLWGDKKLCEQYSKNCKDISFDTIDEYYEKIMKVYGYIRNSVTKRNEIDPEAAFYVQLIFQWELMGVPIFEIARRMTLLQVPTPREWHRKMVEGKEVLTCKKWGVTTIRHILENQTYVGDTINNKSTQKLFAGQDKHDLPKEQWYVAKNTHPAIIARDDFEKVQKILNKNRAVFKTVRAKSEQIRAEYQNDLAGMVFCADCGRPMEFERLPHGAEESKKVCYYICKARQADDKCIGHQIPEKLLKALIMDQLHLFIVQLSDKRKVLEELQKIEDVQNPVYRAKGEIMSLTDKVSQMAKKREQLYADYVAGVVDSEDYQLIREDYSRQYDGLRAALQEAENKKAEVERQIEEYLNMTSHLEEHLDNFEFDIQLVKSLVQKIEVSADKRIRIVFGFQDVFTELGKESAET